MLLPNNLHLLISDEANSNIDEANSKRVDYEEHEVTNGKLITASFRDIRIGRCFEPLILRTSPGELENYCLMWSLHLFVNDEIMHQA
ncbi:hypothetical protein R6Q59_027949 [Mikania micrantha]